MIPDSAIPPDYEKDESNSALSDDVESGRVVSDAKEFDATIFEEELEIILPDPDVDYLINFLHSHPVDDTQLNSVADAEVNPIVDFLHSEETQVEVVSSYANQDAVEFSESMPENVILDTPILEEETNQTHFYSALIDTDVSANVSPIDISSVNMPQIATDSEITLNTQPDLTAVEEAVTQPVSEVVNSQDVPLTVVEETVTQPVLEAVSSQDIPLDNLSQKNKEVELADNNVSVPNLTAESESNVSTEVQETIKSESDEVSGTLVSPANQVVEAVKDNQPLENTSKIELNPLLLDLNSDELTFLESTVNPNKNIQVQFKSEAERLLLILPTEVQAPTAEYSWSDIWQQIQLRFKGLARRLVPNTIVHLVAQDRLLDGRQLQALAESLAQMQLQLKSVATCRRQTAIAAVTAGYSVEQTQPTAILSSPSKTFVSPQADALYLEMTVRSGVEIRHPGSIIILGDVNPGGIVIADGDILVWGRLRGLAHAGIKGNRESIIMALQMEPTQLRIADAVARAPDKTPTQFHPEVAYVTLDGIRIAKAGDFSRTQKSI